MSGFVPPYVHRLIDMALDEDLAHGDVTSRLTIPTDAMGTGRAVSKGDLVISGVDVFIAVMKRVDPEIQVVFQVEEGNEAKQGDLLVEVSGPTRSLLMAERVALNFVQRLSGVATLTREFARALPKGSKTRITDTRKTTPGMSFLERRAVRHGGGINHRVDLSGGILIKENHIAAAGSIQKAIHRCEHAPHPLNVEIEVRNIEEMIEAVEAGADAVLLDNMTPGQIAGCVRESAGRVFIEVSGGVSQDTIGDLAIDGVDAISVGALTHSAPSGDISFLLESVKEI